MRNKGVHTTLFVVIILGIIIIGNAAAKEYLFGNICPDFTIIPTCYVALAYVILLLIFHIRKNGVLWFLLLSGFAVVLAVFASIKHYLGTTPCAISVIGVPTCYIGLVLFVVMLGLKFLEVKSNKKP